MLTQARILGLILLEIALTGHCMALTTIPACPVGSQRVQWNDVKRPYIYYECKLPQKTNNIEMCREWEGTQWSPTASVPCGSRVSSAVIYTGTLKCPISQQVYLWNTAANAMSKSVSCLPLGWAAHGQPDLKGACPHGYVSGSPAEFGQDTCYGPRPAKLQQFSCSPGTQQLAPGQDTCYFKPQQDLLAYDINGFKLDMTLKQVRAVAGHRLFYLGGGQFKTSVKGVDYNFGFSILGHLFRINSRQNLGQFIPDAAYTETVTEQLSAKYGPPQTNQLPGGPADWQFVQPYSNPNGPVLNQITVELSAMLSGFGTEPKSFDMQLIDFRIVRRDLAKANAGPRSRAQESTSF